MQYFISDTHLGDFGIAKYQSDFSSLKERDEMIISNWNSIVKRQDDVYIIGDLISHQYGDFYHILRRLEGQKHLIIGNHDHDLILDRKARTYFVSIDDIKFIRDEETGRGLVLCHYPMAEWNGYQRGVDHIYGHIHENSKDVFRFMFEKGMNEPDKGRAYNACVMINNNKPCTLEEIKANNLIYYNSLNVTPKEL